MAFEFTRSQKDHASSRLIDLSGSNPTTADLPYDGRAITTALAKTDSLVYAPEAFGLRSAREVVARSIAHAPPLDRILLTASTSEAYALLFKLLCDPNDAVAIPEPSYPLFEHLATLEGVRLRPYRLAYDGAWHVDVDSLRAACAKGTTAVIVVSPNNPTGSFLKMDEHDAIARIGLPIIADEVFAEYAYGDDARRVATTRERDDVLTFSMSGLSKSAGLPQMKLAWTCITGPEAAVHEATARLEIVADAYLSPSAPIQHALPELLAAGAITRRAIRERVIENQAAMARLIETRAAPISLFHAEGGWTACARLPRTRSEEDWVLGLLESARVIVQPGAFYDFADEPVVVLSLLGPPSDFAEGFQRVIEYVTRS